MRGRLEVSGFPDPDRRRAIKRLGRKVASSPRDSTAREHHLPWARCSIPTDPRRVKGSPAPAPIRTAAAAACSRGVNVGSAPPARRPVTAPRLASGQPVAGGVGGPLSATAPPTTARSADVFKVNATASVSAAHGSSRTRHGPRASAQPQFRKIFRDAPATDPVVTNSSSHRRAPPISTSVRRPAARLCVVSASVTFDAWSAAAAVHDPGAFVFAHRRKPRVNVVTYFSPYAIALLWLPTPIAEEGAGGADLLRPPVSFL
jgi:hypothetical protein